MQRVQTYTNKLKKVFESVSDKHQASFDCHNILADMSGDKELFTEILTNFLRKEGNLNQLHYPVIGMPIGQNEHFVLAANCWIPLPSRETNYSTKSIHHHGDMLLSTATAFGTGYEHWTFATPTEEDLENEIWNLKVIEQAPHPLNHVAFVDDHIAHVPFYPPDLTITYVLWTNRFPTSWKDKLKRTPLLQKNSERLKAFAKEMGLVKHLEIKVIEYFDFFPTSSGFKGLKDRKEFELSNNEDYLPSLFHVIQETGNEHLASIIYEKLDSNEKIDNPNLVKKYLNDLESGIAIDGRISANHFGFEYANFTKEQVLEALTAQAK